MNGPAALTSVDEALRDIRREEDDIVRRLGRGTEIVGKLRLQEGELFRQLLAMRLEQGSRAALSAEIAAAEATAGEALDQHTRDLSSAEAALQSLDDEIAKLQEDRARLQAGAAERDAQLRALAARARPRLVTDVAYARTLEASRTLSAAAELASRKVAQAEASRERNGRPYRDDPLFMYLWEKGYGARTYRASALVGWLDGRIARLIGFEGARANFVALNDIPLRLRDHASQLQQQAQAAALEIAAVESEAVDTAGGGAAREGLREAVTGIDAIDHAVMQREDQRDDAIKSIRELAQGSQPGYANAMRMFSGVIERGELRVLLAEARATPKGQDPTLVQQLDDIRRRARDEDEEVRGQRARLKTLASRRRDLEDLRAELKALGFDNPQSQFGDDDLVGDALNVFLRGEISIAGYWDRWRQAQSWGAPGYGGPGGGWGLLARPAGASFGRSRSSARNDGLISAA
ncbi:MAG: hypothetical protein ABI697_08435 [Devosia sp.]